MKAFSKFILTIMIISFLGVSAQDFQGIATYKTQRKMDISLDSTSLAFGLQDQIMARLKKQFQKTYTLVFNKEESVYKEEESLGAPTPQGIRVIAINTGGGDIMYKNTKEKRFVNQNDVYGKQFLIKDKLQEYDWKLTSETKHIGEYTCYKATYTREVEVNEERFGLENNSNSESNPPRMEERTATVWYTPEIPINNGPESYYGLPGLILEVNDGNQTIVCSKIILNPKKKVEVKVPTKGKIVTQERYNDIVEKKAREIIDNFSGGGRDGEQIEIRIGG